MSDYIVKENSDGSKIYLKDVQAILLDILSEFDRIINKYDLDYTLAFGSELGAIRHQGFIPWDDDIDIFMLREDYLKLIEILKTELKSPYYFQCFEVNDKYNVLTPTMKIMIEDTVIKEKTLITNKLGDNGLFIDIFLFESISENKLNHLFHRTLSTLIMPIIIILDLIKIDSRFFNKMLYNYAIYYSNKNKDSKYAYLNLCWTFDSLKDRRLLKSDVFPSKKAKFEDKEFRVSNNSHNVLKVVYGENYMQAPSIEKQKPHHIDEIIINRKKRG